MSLRQTSVKQFCVRSQELLDADDADGFVKFILSGVDGDEQVVLDPILNRATLLDGFFTARDYDSLLGFYEDILISGSALTAYPLAYRDDTLSSNVHIKRLFVTSRGSFEAAIHKVPNICLGKWGTHNMLRIYLPELYDEEHPTPFLTQAQQQVFYEKGLRPAIEELLGDKAAEWPTTYQGEMWRARAAHSGALRFQTKIIAEWNLPELGQAIRDALEKNEIAWHNGLVFLHQIRGLKHGTTHTVTEEAAEGALVEFLRENGLSDIEQVWDRADWWVDVGLEISSMEGNCVVWRTDSHFHIVQTAIGIDDDNAQRITRPGSTKYNRDLSAHLTAVSGCRITPGVRAQGEAHVQYLQMYTTDKSLTYHPDGRGRFGKSITAGDALFGKAQTFVDSLYKVYIQAIQTNHSLARVELRVPLNCAHTVLLNLDDNLIRRSLVVFPKIEWWCFRAYRALAIEFVLRWQNEGEPTYRARPHALMLTAAATWLLNCLHSTPDLGASSRELLVSVLPSISGADADPNALAFGSITQQVEEPGVESDSSDSDGVGPRQRRSAYPGYPYGAIFLEGLRIGRSYPVPRMTKTIPELGSRAMRYFFGYSLDEIQGRFFASGALVRSNVTRTRNKVRKTASIDHGGNHPQMNPQFKLAGRGYRIEPPMRDSGSDGEAETDEGSQASPESIISSSADIDLVLEMVWTQFLHDITAKAPNPKSASESSYCKLTEEERLNANEDTFKNHRLSDYFSACRWKVVKGNDVLWDRVFDHLWLGEGLAKAGQVQGYGTMSYFSWWEQIKARVDSETIQKMKAVIKARYDKLYWVPYAQSDRMWNTRPAKSLSSPPGLHPDCPAPQILVKGSAPLWVSL